MYSSLNNPFAINPFLLSWYHQQLQHSAPASAFPWQTNVSGNTDAHGMLTSLQSPQFFTTLEQQQHRSSMNRSRDLSLSRVRSRDANGIYNTSGEAIDITTQILDRPGGYGADGGSGCGGRREVPESASRSKTCISGTTKKFDFRRLAESVMHDDVTGEFVDDNDVLSDVRTMDDEEREKNERLVGDRASSFTVLSPPRAASVEDAAARLYLQWSLSGSLPVAPVTPFNNHQHLLPPSSCHM